MIPTQPSWPSTTLRIVLAVLFVLAFAIPSRAQQADKTPPKSTATAKRKVIRTKGRASMSGTDANVKSFVITSTLTGAATLAPNKLKVKTGSTAPGFCAVHVDNWTSATVHIFLAGDYAGSVTAGNEISISIPNGPSIFYARIDLDTTTWIPLGPENIDCDGIFSFTITP